MQSDRLKVWSIGTVTSIGRNGMIAILYGKGNPNCGAGGCRKTVTPDQYGTKWEFKPFVGDSVELYSRSLLGLVEGRVADIGQDGSITLHYGMGTPQCGTHGCSKVVTPEDFGILWRFN